MELQRDDSALGPGPRHDLSRGDLTLRALAPGLHVAEQPLRFYGVPVGARMSVVQLGTGGVLLYSPIAPSDQLRAAVAALGEVRLIVAPNRWHHLFAAAWQELAPTAETWIAAGLRDKRKDLEYSGVLVERASPFDADVDHHCIAGAPLMDETVLLHRPSRSLLCCDLVHNVGDDAPLGQRLFMKILGGFGGVKTSLLDRMAVRDRAAVKASLQAILAWDFDRIVMAHGRICDSDGKKQLRDAFAWLLD